MEFKMTNNNLDERIQRLEDIHEIGNLMGRYSYFRTAGLYEPILEMFARETEGLKVEISDWGVWEGTEGIIKLYHGAYRMLEGDRIGLLNIQALSTPVIEIAGDGKTAQAVWISPGFQTIAPGSKLQAYWTWFRYGVDFIKENNGWKFWHLHQYDIFLTTYNKSWVETPLLPPPPLPGNVKADRPTTYHRIYRPDIKTKNVPAPPCPYPTWNESQSYIE
ncbi:MAG: hypothetical protein A2Z02_04930 [Chloroflexi bacterium RBG_16_48_7]|nr:MAG: hypothetical protein A2Z02_04930 [Chloroflexi bacterium RBG_16_48_7]